MSRFAKISRLVWSCSLFCIGLYLGFFNPATARAQGIITGALTGFIQDSSGAVIPNVPIVAVNNQTGAIFRTATGGDGTFTLRDLPIGDYNVNIVSPAGFGKATVQSVRVVAGITTSIGNQKLQTGTTTETVQVAANSASLLDTTTPRVVQP